MDATYLQRRILHMQLLLLLSYLLLVLLVGAAK
jgi:hypothetical protein